MTIITPHGDRTESFAKANILANLMFDLTRVLAELPEAVDMDACGNSDSLNDIYDKIKELRETISGEDRHQVMRIKPVNESKVLRVLDSFLAQMDNRSIDPDKAVAVWGETYAKFLTSCEEMKASQNQMLLAEERRNMRSKSQDQIPTKTDRSGIVIYRKASIVFTTAQPIGSSKFVPAGTLRHMPEEFEVVKYASGYVINNQIVLGINKDDPDSEEKVKQTLAAFRVQGKPMVNLLENSRRALPYFYAKNNPLQFVWLFPESAWALNTFKVVSVQFNTSEAEEFFSPHAARAHVKNLRQQFEAYLASDKRYLAAKRDVENATDAREKQKLERKLQKIVEDLRTLYRQENQQLSA